LFIPGEAAVADAYLGEFMRMFNHYQFRSAVKASKAAKAGSSAANAAFLPDSDAWTQRYFAGDRVAARLAFFG
jgi:hypothetical protein